KVHIHGLKAGRVYSYTVQCEGRESQPYTFKTAPERDQSFKFVAYGDTRTQPAVHASVIERIIKFKPDFVLQTRDMVANGEVQALWDDEFWPTVRRLVCDTPMYPVLGNHENSGAPYFQYFDVPREYSFDYGN